jgi:hypothetical protein
MLLARLMNNPRSYTLRNFIRATLDKPCLLQNRF